MVVLTISFRHLVKDVGKLVQLLDPRSSLDETASSHVKDLQSLSPVAYS